MYLTQHSRMWPTSTLLSPYLSIFLVEYPFGLSFSLLLLLPIDSAGPWLSLLCDSTRLDLTLPLSLPGAFIFHLSRRSLCGFDPDCLRTPSLLLLFHQPSFDTDGTPLFPTTQNSCLVVNSYSGKPTKVGRIASSHSYSLKKSSNTRPFYEALEHPRTHLHCFGPRTVESSFLAIHTCSLSLSTSASSSNRLYKHSFKNIKASL